MALSCLLPPQDVIGEVVHAPVASLDEFERVSEARRAILKAQREAAASKFECREELRHTTLISAWRTDETEVLRRPISKSSEASGDGPKFPCLAVSIDDSHRGSANILRASSLGKPVTIKEGTHSFVALQRDGESPSLRLTLMAFPFGHSCGHPLLANEQDVLFAGEIEFDKDQAVTRWNNLSGTYRAPECLAIQAGLPMDKFWSLRESKATSTEEVPGAVASQDEGEEILIIGRDRAILRMVRHISTMSCRTIEHAHGCKVGSGGTPAT